MRASVALGIALTVCGPTAFAQAYSVNEMRSVEEPKEAQIRELRDQEINQLRIALGRRLPQNRKADLYFRLAELYLEAYRQTFLMEGRVHHKRLERNPKAKLERNLSLPYLKLGIKACEDLIRLGAPSDRMDAIYYFLGFNHNELGNTKKSDEYFKALTSRYPGSVYAFDAFREIGESAFGKRDYRKAQAYLEQALKARRQDIGPQPRLLYYLAWSYYRLKQHDRAIQTMKRAIQEATAEDERFLSIREEALRDMAIFLTERGDVGEALSYFAQVQSDDTYYPKLLERLGREYERNVQLPKAIQVYDTLLRTKPNSESAYRVAMKLIALEIRKGNVSAAVSRIQKLPKEASRSAETEVEYQNLKALVRKTATENHDLVRKGKGSKSALQAAESLYAVYLDHFLAQEDKRKEMNEIRMYLADVKREQGKSAEASALYKKIIESKDEKYAKEAVSLWVGALADALKSQKPSQKTASAAEPSALEREFVEAAKYLEDKQGVSHQTTELMLRSAQLLAAYAKTQEDAVDLADKVIQREPGSKAALTAAKLKIQLASDRAAAKKDGDDLRSALKDLRSNEALLEADRKSGGELGKIIATQDEKFKLEDIQSLEKSSDHAKAAEAYEKFALETQDKEKSDKAFNNAIVYYGKAGDSESVSRVASVWMKRDPKDPRPVNVLKESASRLFIDGKFTESAKAFEGLGILIKDPVSIETAAEIFLAEKKASDAIRAFESLLKMQKSRSDAGEIQLKLAKLYLSQGGERSAASYFSQCASDKTLEAECQARLGDMHEQLKDRESASRAYQKAVRSKAPSPYRAYAAYRMAQVTTGGRPASEPFSNEPAQAKKQLDGRIAFVEKLSRAYAPAIEAGGPWGIAALEELAQTVRTIADDLAKIVPQTDQTKKLSDSLRQQSLQSLKTAFERCEREEILSPAIPRVQTPLARRGWVKGAPAQGSFGGFRISGMPANGGDSSALKSLEQVRKKLHQNGADAVAWTDYGNLLWGQGFDGVAKVAYERALASQPSNVYALNNRAVVVMSSADTAEWTRPLEAQSLLRKALEKDSFYTVAKMNLAQLYNYYRLFRKAHAYWEQVSVKHKDGQVYAGLAISTQGLGDFAQAAAQFEKAFDHGISSSGFVGRFHEAARQKEREACLKGLDRVSIGDLQGLERDAVEALKEECKP